MNKFKIILLIGFLQSFGVVYAKDESPIDSTMFTVGYNFRVNTKNADGVPVVDSLQTVLLVGHQYTKTMGYHCFWTKINGETQETFDLMAGEEKAHVPTILRDIAQKTLTVYEDIPVHHYVYEESGDRKWQMLDDTLTIRGFLCSKATTNYAGRTWTAWYTDEVPSTAGPWKFSGLPGLIVKCTDEKGIFNFELFELLNKVFPITNEEAKRPNMKIKRDKFVERRNKLFLSPRYPQDPLYYHVPSDTDHSGYSLYSIEKTPRNPDGSIPLNMLTKVINGVAIPWKCNEYQPLELK
jgi:GLPGLI family protein